MIPPHAAYEDGRIIVLDDGPLHFHDLRDLYVHVRERHRRVPEVFYCSDDQIRWIHTEPRWEEARQYMQWPLTDPLLERFPGLVDYIWGVGIARKRALDNQPWGPRDNGYARATRIAQHGDEILYATATPAGTRVWMDTTTLAEREAELARWKVQFGTMPAPAFFGGGGKKIDGVWLDEKKPPRTTHEVW